MLGCNEEYAYGRLLAVMDADDEDEKKKFEDLFEEDFNVLQDHEHANTDKLLDYVYRLAVRWGVDKDEALDHKILKDARKEWKTMFTARLSETKKVMNEEIRARRAKKQEEGKEREAKKAKKGKKKAKEIETGESSKTGAAQ
jgi:hypothetical protein